MRDATSTYGGLCTFSRTTAQNKVLFLLFKCDDNTFRKWSWVVINRIAEFDYVSLSNLIHF